MIIGCNIWMICLELNWLYYDPSGMLQLSEFVLRLHSLVWVVFDNFLLIDATDRIKTVLDGNLEYFNYELNSYESFFCVFQAGSIFNVPYFFVPNSPNPTFSLMYWLFFLNLPQIFQVLSFLTLFLKS